MKFTILGKNIEVTKGLEDAARGKFGRLDRFFEDETPCTVTFSVQKDRQTVEVTIRYQKTTIHTEQTSTDMYASIDLAEEILERQIRRYRTKIFRNEKGAASIRSFVPEETDGTEEGIRIVRRKQFDMKPMFPEDACVQMELLGHAFYVFRNAETDEINVVYRRKDGTYGLIEPENS